MLKKFSSYFLKILRHKDPKDFYYILKYVPLHQLPKALMARLDGYKFYVQLKGDMPRYELNKFLDLLKYRQKKVAKDLYLWDYHGKKVYADEVQFIGLQAEYLDRLFDYLYALDWTHKIVLDIGGFVGDSALFFLEEGADKVIIYEPLEKNMRALKYNLEPYKNKIELHQKALAKQDGPVTISSKAPEGDLGFGYEDGKYKLQCEGVSISTLLKMHHVDVVKVDCEGGERYLAEATPEELRTVHYWIIESHSADLYAQVTHAFEQAGFVKVRDFFLGSEIHLMHFALP